MFIISSIPQVHIMKSTEGIKDEERDRGFTSKIIITYDVRLKEPQSL